VRCQLDISATFEVDDKALEGVVEADTGFNCTSSAGSAGRGALGPFGLAVIADELLSELTPIYFYIAKGIDGKVVTHFCADETRSSLDSNVRKMVVGSKVPVLQGEKLSMRLLVDHSVVESFAQGGRIAVTSRVYPTKAIYEAAHLFLFNNATGISVKASLKIWHMGAAQLSTYPFLKE